MGCVIAVRFSMSRPLPFGMIDKSGSGEIGVGNACMRDDKCSRVIMQRTKPDRMWNMLSSFQTNSCLQRRIGQGEGQGK